MNIVSIVGRLSVAIFLGMAYFAICTGYGIWRLIFQSDALGKLDISASQYGFLFSVSAIPGMLAFMTGWFAQKVRLAHLSSFGCLSLGVGLIWVGLATSLNLLWPGVLAISAGFSCFYAVINTLGLQNSGTEKTSVYIGRLKSCGPLAAIGSALVIHVAFVPLGSQTILILSGIFVVLAGGAAVLSIPYKVKAQAHGSLNFKIRLWPYYALNFVAGCRSALFKNFTLLFLARKLCVNAEDIALIALAGNLFSLLGFRLIGKLAGHYDHRNILSVIYAGVSVSFVGFCYMESRLFLTFFYFLDSLLLGASVITDTHLKKASPPHDHIGDIATGFALFQLAGVIVPLAGGLMWEHFNQRTTFLVGSLFAVMGILISRKLGPSKGTLRNKSAGLSLRFRCFDKKPGRIVQIGCRTCQRIGIDAGGFEFSSATKDRSTLMSSLYWHKQDGSL